MMRIAIDENLSEMPRRRVTSIRIKTLPLAEFICTNCICDLSDVANEQSENARAYAILPYSNPIDPTVVVAEYEMQPDIVDDRPITITRPPRWKWWRMYLLGLIVSKMPRFQKFVQRKLDFKKSVTWKTRTFARDLDYKYHLAPGASIDSLRPFYWMMRPTFVLYNIALHVKPEDTERFIHFVIENAELIRPNLLRNFIGVRELTDRSAVSFAGNYDGPRNAVDLYCSPRDAKYLQMLQFRCQNEFDTRPHMGKTVLSESG